MYPKFTPTNPPALRAWLAIATIVSVTLISACGGGDSPPIADAPAAPVVPAAPVIQPLASCDAIQTGFKPDNDTTVLLVKEFKKGDSIALSGTPATPTPPVAAADMCMVKLLVGPGNPGPAGAPSTSAGIGIEVWLPAKAAWNKRLHAMGGGGFAGGTHTSLALSGYSLNVMREPWDIVAREGAMSALTDTGHTDSLGAFAMSPDGTINTTLWQDFAWRGLHELAVKSKALAAAYYGNAPKYSYFDGFSTGGRQGMKLAQSFPEDFDGILSGAPAINWSTFILAELYPQTVIQRDLAGVNLSTAQKSLVGTKAVTACDTIGIGYLLDPSSCTYDPTTDVTVLCTGDGGTNATAACLTTVQARVVNKWWYGMTTDGSAPNPAADNGWAISPAGQQRWYGMPRGTNFNAPASLVSAAPFATAPIMAALVAQDSSIAPTSFVNATGNGTDAWKNLTYSRLSQLVDQGNVLQSPFANINTDNPDLSKFKARGGKLIGFHGTNDPLIFPQGTINYYNRVALQMGGYSSVQDFYKFYLVPGMGHLNSTRVGTETRMATANADTSVVIPTPSFEHMYEKLTDWVEKGVAPNRLNATTASTAPTPKSMSLCAYPSKIRYVSGDVNAATSYTCR